MDGVTGRRCLLAFAIGFLLLPQSVWAQVLISEVMYNPKGTDTGREWIELSNAGDADVTLVGGSGKGAWKIADSSNHVITDPSGGVGRGSLTIPAHGYLVIASDPSNFMSEYPGGSYAVVKASLTLNNTGGAISLLDGSGAAADTFAYTKDMGGNDDGTSLQRAASGWITALPTPGASNATEPYVTTETDSSTSNASTSEPVAQTAKFAPVSSYVSPPKPSLYADAGDDRIVIVGADTEFDARAYDKNQSTVDTARFVWNFGDGGTAEGESVSHHFGYPGTYDVIVDIAHDKFAASDEIIVTAAPAAIVFSILADGGVEIANESGHELDLSGWVVRKDSGLFSPMFVLPSHSRVVADAAMRIAPDTLGFKAGPDVSLEYPNGSHAFSAGERLQELRAPIQDASVTAKTPVVSTVLSSKNVVASKSIKRIRTVSKGSVPTQSDSEEGVDPSVSPQTNVAQSASVAQSEALSLWWWVGALALAGVAGVGVIVAKKAAKKEWNIIEDTSE